ncbi:integrin beta-PS-like [Diachasmimorpha longicaudata]|uniref:integrin beta-PS-like n=1 Tax=Diachasmimorpha longicaudata TaxID=58733 RepID=UPI0030B91AFF
MRISGFVIILLSILKNSAAEDGDQDVVDCAAQLKCSSCIKTPACVWCPATGLNASNVLPARCIPRRVHEERIQQGRDWCFGHKIIDEVSSIAVEKNDSLSSVKGKEPVQVQPQNIRLKLRRREEFRLKLRYTQAEDNPVDMYYLMDLSASMREYRKHLSELGEELAATMRNLTSKFKIGFGSFVDKVALPMTDTSPAKLIKPCDDCASPYGYKHQLALTDDDKSFTRQVKAAPISGNLDAPEGGFDAMMQAMVCTERIGWNENARHLLVVSTDASSHMAGDGRLAGIIEPNDGQCHLDSSGTYTHSLLQDYPSLAQINKQARDHNIHVVFAVPALKNETYQMLSRGIRDSAVGIIEKHDRSAVIQLMQDEYQKLVTSVTLIDTAPDFIDVKYSSSCLSGIGEKETNFCDGLHYGDIVEFDIVVTATECPADQTLWKGSFLIRPQGVKENLTIDYELICGCPCDHPGHSGHITNAKECNHKGALICGVCDCPPGYYDDACACPVDDDPTTKKNRVKNCRAANHTVDCSGHDVCICGKCQCSALSSGDKVYYGDYCECNNFSCNRVTEGGRHLICNNHGECMCGTCRCQRGWSGEACECRDNACLPPGKNTEICSGRGECKCGKCLCNPPSIYSGEFCQNAYCEDPKACSGSDCDLLKDCVECFAYKTGPKAKENCGGCDDEISYVDKVVTSREEHAAGTRMCWVPSEDGCTFAFKYALLREGGDQKLYNITVERTKKCPEAVPVLGVAIGVVVATVLLGLLGLVIWKVLTTIHDRREYAKFEKERSSAKWGRDENPLYKPSTTTFSNPTFEQTRQQ